MCLFIIGNTREKNSNSLSPVSITFIEKDGGGYIEGKNVGCESERGLAVQKIETDKKEH